MTDKGAGLTDSQRSAFQDLFTGDCKFDVAIRYFAAGLAARAEGVPVAWLYRERDGEREVVVLDAARWGVVNATHWTETPLYAAPAPDRAPEGATQDQSAVASGINTGVREAHPQPHATTATPAQAEPAKEPPAPTDQSAPDAWQQSALAVGEALYTEGSVDYYAMTPQQWREWMIAARWRLTGASGSSPQQEKQNESTGNAHQNELGRTGRNIGGADSLAAGLVNEETKAGREGAEEVAQSAPDVAKLVGKLRYMARQYTAGQYARGGDPSEHYLDQAAATIERLTARVAELERERADVVNELGHDEDEFHEPCTLAETARKMTWAYQERARYIVAAAATIERLTARVAEVERERNGANTQSEMDASWGQSMENKCVALQAELKAAREVIAAAGQLRHAAELGYHGGHVACAICIDCSAFDAALAKWQDASSGQASGEGA